MVDSRRKSTSFTSVVDYMNDSGEAIIELGGNKTINLGPLDKSVVGEEVEFRLQASNGGKYLGNEFKLDSENKKEYIRKQQEETGNVGTLESGNEDPSTSVSDPDEKNKLLKGDM